jgi:RNA polymerase sigma-70 factor, ECF subfamily
VNANPPLEFPRIYEEYRPKVRAYVVKLIGRDEADDVVQEVFIKVRRALPDLTDAAKLAAWLHAITLNTVRDAVRRRASRAQPPIAAPEPDEGRRDDPLCGVPDCSSRGPEEYAIRNEMIDCYLSYVDQLPSSYRGVYVLAELEQLSNDEIARRLSLSVGTVKIRLHRARSRLFEVLRRDCQCYVNERGDLMGTRRCGPRGGDSEP